MVFLFFSFSYCFTKQNNGHAHVGIKMGGTFQNLCKMFMYGNVNEMKIKGKQDEHYLLVALFGW